MAAEARADPSRPATRRSRGSRLPNWLTSSRYLLTPSIAREGTGEDALALVEDMASVMVHGNAPEASWSCRFKRGSSAYEREPASPAAASVAIAGGPSACTDPRRSAMTCGASGRSRSRSRGLNSSCASTARCSATCGLSCDRCCCSAYCGFLHEGRPCQQGQDARRKVLRRSAARVDRAVHLLRRSHHRVGAQRRRPREHACARSTFRAW